MDFPKSLGGPQARNARLRMLRARHIAPLTRFVERLRDEKGPRFKIPYFDPLDAGVRAECLFLLEAPGPNAIRSGFVSRNNPDETAKNFLTFNRTVGIDRTRTVIWNVVPWYVGAGTRIRPVNRADITAALDALETLLSLLPHVRIVVLTGKKAASARSQVERFLPRAQVFDVPHPSPMFVNRAPANRVRVLKAMRQVASALRVG